MVTYHAMERAIQRINNDSRKKNKKDNLKKIMTKDVYKRYFAYSINTFNIFRYVQKNDKTYKYVLDKLNKKIITVYEVDFEEELKKNFKISFVRQ